VVIVDLSVDAAAGWVSTGIVMQPGDTIHLIASGLASPNVSPPAGGPDGDGSTCPVACLANVAGSRYALVGHIGSQEFIVGSDSIITAQVTGTLELGFNDHLGSYGDNNGGFTVNSVP
jgi:hypothetical protein